MSKKGSKATKPDVSTYDIGDTVLGKVRGYPPWPGRVADPETLPEKVKTERPTKKSLCYSVQFFPTGDYAWLTPKDISRLRLHEIEAYISDPAKRSGDLLQGYKIARDPTEWSEALAANRADEEEAEADVDEEDELEEDERVASKKRKAPSSTAASTSKKRKRESEPAAKAKGSASSNKINIAYLSFSKIGKVMRHITALSDDKVPLDAKYKFRDRAKVLVEQWQHIINASKDSTSSSQPTNTNGRNGKDHRSSKETTNGASPAKNGAESQSPGVENVNGIADAINSSIAGGTMEVDEDTRMNGHGHGHRYNAGEDSSLAL
ncbi:Tudor/PWWP/MBT [Gymnopus androsaceus JB14]|uniref:Tudor/PWWP/MBT n=1 Tax=Gymnopus androsaceus JB14 TaxID=1447944 RepID=A0A6A4GX79_9AGAR|nr:Tudor/PWWP/MBT [Gymnopus androsaceus JB14]